MTKAKWRSDTALVKTGIFFPQGNFLKNKENQKILPQWVLIKKDMSHLIWGPWNFYLVVLNHYLALDTFENVQKILHKKLYTEAVI